jgi:hypothetical protein
MRHASETTSRGMTCREGDERPSRSPRYPNARPARDHRHAPAILRARCPTPATTTARVESRGGGSEGFRPRQADPVCPAISSIPPSIEKWGLANLCYIESLRHRARLRASSGLVPKRQRTRRTIFLRTETVPRLEAIDDPGPPGGAAPPPCSARRALSHTRTKRRSERRSLRRLGGGS